MMLLWGSRKHCYLNSAIWMMIGFLFSIFRCCYFLLSLFYVVFVRFYFSSFAFCWLNAEWERWGDFRTPTIMYLSRAFSSIFCWFECECCCLSVNLFQLRKHIRQPTPVSSSTRRETTDRNSCVSFSSYFFFMFSCFGPFVRLFSL